MNNPLSPYYFILRKEMIQYNGKILFILLFTLILFSSCNTQRKIIKAPIREEGADYLFKKLKEHELNYSTFKAAFSADYENKGQTSSFSGQIRIHRDSMIWLSFTPALGIEVLRMLVTQDSVKFINNMNKTFFKGDYTDVNRYLNTNIDFDIIQSFLTGNDLSFYENGKFRVSIDNNLYKLSTAGRMKLKKFIRNSREHLRVLIQNIWIDPQNFKIIHADVKEIEAPNLKLQADYASFEKVGEQLFPKTMSFDISADNNIRVGIDLSRITINTVLVLPFKIPQSYRPVKQNPDPEK